MKKAIIACILALFMSAQVDAHSGRTDSSGGHNCSAKSKKKGLCSGYHSHVTKAPTKKKTKKKKPPAQY